MRKRKAVFLDRDGTINKDKGYTYKIEDFKFIDGSVSAIRMLNEAGFKVIVITGQSGIGRGYYTVYDMQRVHDHMLLELNKNGARVDKIYFCHHAPEDNCLCRKPSPAMIIKAMKDFRLDPNNCFMVGDKDEDVKAGKAAGCKSILVQTGRDKKSEHADFVFKDLLSAVRDGILL